MQAPLPAQEQYTYTEGIKTMFQVTPLILGQIAERLKTRDQPKHWRRRRSRVKKGKNMHKIVNNQIVEFTQEEVASYLAAQAIAAATEYISLRKVDYNPIGDQLDTLFHELDVSGTLSKDGEWANHIRQVKLDHPKP